MLTSSEGRGRGFESRQARHQAGDTFATSLGQRVLEKDEGSVLPGQSASWALRLSRDTWLNPAAWRPSRCNRKLNFPHGSSLCTAANDGREFLPSGWDVACGLLQIDDHELGRFEWRESDLNVDDPEFDVEFGGRLTIAFHEVGFPGRASSESSLAE